MCLLDSPHCGGRLVDGGGHSLNTHDNPRSWKMLGLTHTTGDHQQFPCQPGSECSHCWFVQYGAPDPLPEWEPAEKLHLRLPRVWGSISRLHITTHSTVGLERVRGCGRAPLTDWEMSNLKLKKENWPPNREKFCSNLRSEYEVRACEVPSLLAERQSFL